MRFRKIRHLSSICASTVRAEPSFPGPRTEFRTKKTEKQTRQQPFFVFYAKFDLFANFGDNTTSARLSTDSHGVLAQYSDTAYEFEQQGVRLSMNGS